ncbi:hypothetical protein [Oleidesulfovibrio alaskensis]|jgi:hypothetical protein|uniref:hypothetical protein n=1 Tax=Oleidesulfovibrio alaskensis TaxID=58180 RepID=UPI0004167959|nr:hypothetical protein [Oleidesulfovibrio alaskensis]
MATIESYPAMLPKPTMKGYTAQPTDRRQQTEMEIGTRTRNLFGADETLVSVQWVMDAEQYAIFEAWEQNILDGGSKWFRMQLLTGTGLNDHEAKFKERPTASVQGTLWTVTARLQLAQRNMLTADQTRVVIAAGGFAPLAAATDALHTLVHVTLPGEYWQVPEVV